MAASPSAHDSGASASTYDSDGTPVRPVTGVMIDRAPAASTRAGLGDVQLLGDLWLAGRTSARWRRSASCARADADEPVRRISGLPLDPMFSALKARWLLDHYDPTRRRAAAGELCLGTVDSWLIWQLVGEHRIEVGNAARSQLLDVRQRDWSPELLELFGVPREVLPTVVPSAGPLGEVRGLPGVPTGVPLAGVLGDSHAALFAHSAAPGMVKATFGTGSSVMGLSGQRGRCLGPRGPAPTAPRVRRIQPVRR